MTTFTLTDDQRVVFHGTNVAFGRFDLTHAVPEGNDANGALGIHTAEFPAEAIDYAETMTSRRGGQPRILVLKAITRNPKIFGHEEFFGVDEDGNDVMDAAGFAALRKQLLAEGVDSIEFEDPPEVICVVLDPANVEIVAALTPEAAADVHNRMVKLENQTDDAARLRIVEAVMQKHDIAPFIVEEDAPKPN